MIRRSYILGFTLIELMIVIVILGVLASLVTGQFISSIKKGRDTRRKNDLANIQHALELFYEDKKTYPAFAFTFGQKLCETKTSSDCTPEKVYMQKIPSDPISSDTYRYESNGIYYRLYSCIENGQDQNSGVSQTGWSGGPANCGTGACQICKFVISSSNADPVTPN